MLTHTLKFKLLHMNHTPQYAPFLFLIDPALSTRFYHSSELNFSTQIAGHFHMGRIFHQILGKQSQIYVHWRQPSS